nr:hypothetical protein CFP56_22581 [Quercus suber]
MRSIFAALALPAFFVFSLATPTPVAGDVVAPRDAGASAFSDVAGLYAEIKQYTGAIRAITSHSTLAQNATAQAVYIANIKAITNAIASTDSNIRFLIKSPRSLETRQSSAELKALATLVDDLILEINGALQLVTDTIGLTQAILASLQPLVKILSKLVKDLDVVVDGLLAAVQKLVDGLLGGLSTALDGLVL